MKLIYTSDDGGASWQRAAQVRVAAAARVGGVLGRVPRRGGPRRATRSWPSLGCVVILICGVCAAPWRARRWAP